jgi:predicted secreted protein
MPIPLRPVLAAAVVAAALLAPAAASAQPKSDTQTMTLIPGQKLTLTLLECDSCGYAWQSEATPDPRILTRQSTVIRDGRRVLRYVARARGTTTIKLAYQRTADEAPVQHYTMTIKVR